MNSKCRITCYKKVDYNNIKYFDFYIFDLRLQKSFQIRPRNGEEKSSKYQ